MSTDRELLEMAAKAAGIAVMPCTCGSEKWPLKHNEAATGKRGHWNPLVDDGDAMRLGVKLGMAIKVFDMTSVTMVYPMGIPDYGADEAHGDDPGAATRRAIVRAAAAIGKEKP